MIISEINSVRHELNEILDNDPKITASSIARDINLSKSTLSKYRHGIYPGNNSMISDRLAEWMGSRKIAKEQMAGNLRQVWLVRLSPERIRVAKTRRALEKALTENPDAWVITMWLGMQDLRDVFFSTGGLDD